MTARLPRLTTPERQRFEAFRARQQKQANKGPTRDIQDFSAYDSYNGKTPLGGDPVEGDPVDLRALYDESGYIPADDKQQDTAAADMSDTLSEEGPPGFGEGLDDLI